MKLVRVQCSCNAVLNLNLEEYYASESLISYVFGKFVLLQLGVISIIYEKLGYFLGQNKTTRYENVKNP